MSHVLITGGAGFIGSHLARRLLRRGDRVRVLDRLVPQVHDACAWPENLPGDVDLRIGDVRNPDTVEDALEGIDAVVHLAAAVGVGQSMYEIANYTATNDLGTAVLLEAMAARPVKRLVVASSMSIYGEGMARRADGTTFMPEGRNAVDLAAGRWEVRDDSGPLEPVPTPEAARAGLTSVYALGKYAQERLCLIFGAAYGIPTTALRLFNVYGSHQALSNPYTGVLAIFAARLMNDRPPLVFEDGLQRRDFVHVSDVARAFELALDSDAAAGETINVGSGQPRTIRSVAEDLARVMDRSGIVPTITGKSRTGDIRHCFADISKAERCLDYRPGMDFADGLAEFTGWLATQTARDNAERATRELEARGLVA